MVATHLIYVAMKLLNVFLKQSRISEPYKHFISYSVAALRGGKYYQSNGCSLHGISVNRWSERVDSAKPFIAHLPGVKLALKDLLELNHTEKIRDEILETIFYVSSFTCIAMSVCGKEYWYLLTLATKSLKLVLLLQIWKLQE